MSSAEIKVFPSAKPAAETVRKIRKIARILEREHGPKTWSKRHDPLSQLIMTILSQNTTDTNSQRAFQSLKEQFPDWLQVHQAQVQDVAKAIRCGGLAQIKAHRIKEVLAQICREHADCDLSFLRDWPTERIKVFLAQFAGVGEKTIACVLLFALNRPVMPVDTHVLRVSRRLGLMPPQTRAGKAHQLLQAAVPKDLVYPFHLNLIQHGRMTCKARNPACDRCSLSRECRIYPVFRPQKR